MNSTPRLAGMMALLFLGCSRQPTESPATPVLLTPAAPAPSSGASATGTTAPPTSAASADPSSTAPRMIPLRHNRPLGDMPRAFALDVAPGSPPGAARLAGTAFVVQVGDDDALGVTEWDLAKAAALRSIELDLPSWGLQFLRAPGPSLRLMASGYNGPLYFVQLTKTLRVVTRQQLGTVSVLGPNAFAGDDVLTVILADGIPDPTDSPRDPSGLFATSFDAAGNRLAKRILEPYDEDGGTSSPMMSDNLAVLGDHVYVALVDAAYRLRVLRLTRDLRTEREKRLPLPASFSNSQAKLLAIDGHLVLDLPDSLDLLELPLDLDLAHLTHRPRPSTSPPFPDGGDRCGPALAMGSELLALCNCGAQTCLSWAPLPP